MNGSIERVRAVIQGQTPDRPPLFDLIRNDAIIEHFAGRSIPMDDPAAVVFSAFEPALDATRPLVRLPNLERTEQLPDGRQQRYFRWTIWTSHFEYRDTDDYAEQKRAYLRSFDPTQAAAINSRVEQLTTLVADHRQRLGELFFVPGGPVPGLASIYSECGLEFFAYVMADHPGLIEELLEANTARGEAILNALPEDHGIEVMFVGDDIAFNGGPLLSPTWFKAEFSPRLGRICRACHRQGIKVLFHSDGDLRSIMDCLVEAGIDGLNPIEILSHMDPIEIHRRYPQLFLAGGIDVSQLLPFGTPQQVRDVVVRSIEGTGGRMLVGSSTELHNDVPLANFLAMRQAALDYRY